MDFRDMSFTQAEAAYYALEKKVAELQSALDEANRKLAAKGEPIAEVPEPLTEYASWADVPKYPERWPDTPSTWRRFPQYAMMKQANLYNKEALARGDHLPPKNIIVAGKEYRAWGGHSSRDFVNICNHRVADVKSTTLWAQVQPGDDMYESDEADILRFIREDYVGGLNQPLSSWREDYIKYARELAQARPDLVGDWEWKRLNLTPAGG